MKYRKKPVVIEAVKFNGTITQELRDFLEDIEFHYQQTIGGITRFIITTLEGDMRVSVGDYIIKGINGEFYPCKPDIFEKTYEKVD